LKTSSHTHSDRSLVVISLEIMTALRPRREAEPVTPVLQVGPQGQTGLPRTFTSLAQTSSTRVTTSRGKGT